MRVWISTGQKGKIFYAYFYFFNGSKTFKVHDYCLEFGYQISANNLTLPRYSKKFADLLIFGGRILGQIGGKISI